MYSVLTGLKKALKAAAVAAIGAALAALVSPEVADALKEIPIVGASILAALVAGVEFIRNYLGQKGLPV